MAMYDQRNYLNFIVCHDILQIIYFSKFEYVILASVELSSIHVVQKGGPCHSGRMHRRYQTSRRHSSLGTSSVPGKFYITA